jgi:hypothetical protein
MEPIGMLRNLCLLTLLAAAGTISTSDARAAEGMVNFNSKGVSFSYPMTIGGKFSSKKVAAYPLENPDDKPDGVAPEHWEITFGKTNAHLYVIPTADAKVKNFRTSYPTVADATKDLGALLKKKPTAPKDVPFLPWEDASTPIHSKVKYVSFKNGSGVRYLANYQIEPNVMSNDGLVYSMQGLSADGKYFVSAMIPIKTKSLPDKGNIETYSKEKYDAFSKNYETYSKAQQDKLNKLSDTAFTPSIAELDALVGSIKVQ